MLRWFSSSAVLALRRRSTMYIPIQKADQPDTQSLLGDDVEGAEKEAGCASHDLLTRGGFVSGGSGLFSLLPMGQRVYDKIEAVITEEMDGVGGQKCSLEHVQREQLWQKTGRWADMGKEMFHLSDRRGASLCLAPTHEELVTEVVARTSRFAVDSDGASLRLYQIGRKYRDELRPRFGLLRAKEFVMKDMYSFDRDEEAARATYGELLGAYERVFKRLGLPVAKAAASGGSIGGSLTHEFHILADAGQDEVLECSGCGHTYNSELQQAAHTCPSCGEQEEGRQLKRVGIEVGHTFLLGLKYSQALAATRAEGKDNARVPYYMGCYGIGLTRLIAAAVEQNHDERGIAWPAQIAPFKLAIMTIGKQDDAVINRAAESAYQSLSQLPALRNDVIWHDEARLPGHKFASCELLGYPFVLVIGKQWRENGRYELRVRSPAQTHASLSMEQVLAILHENLALSNSSS